MTVQLELWHLITLLLTFFGVVAGFGKLMLMQFNAALDNRFEAQEKLRQEARTIYAEKFAKLEEDTRVHERRHLELLAVLPVQYVRREDQIRFETSITGKLDALNAKLDLYNERVKRD